MSRNSGISSIHFAVVCAVSLATDGNVAYGYDLSLLQRDVTLYRGKVWRDGETCTNLADEGSYFSVKLCVGTPGQCFDVVADTGSNAVIVPSCICQETEGAGCKKNEKCFRGTNRSSTFRISDPIQFIGMGFGSGSIVTAVATDVVRVGDLSATLEEGVLLMVDRHKLKISGGFQGILGLGVAGSKDSPFLFQQPAHVEASVAPGLQEFNSSKANCSMEPTLCDERALLNQFRGAGWLTKMRLPLPARPHHGRRAGGAAAGEGYKEKLFLTEAKQTRFSLCFKDEEDPGAFRVGIPPFTSPLRHVGKMHWGLDFRGLSVGAHGDPAPVETVFCGSDTMKQGMDSPCGIIPDSGTTQIRGPGEQVRALETSVCSKWERCRRDSRGEPSSGAFRDLLRRCRHWLTKEKGLLEIPSLFLYVKGGDGPPQPYELTAWAWVAEYKTLFGSVCRPIIGSMERDYRTEKNGFIWIFGTPLFYEYDVGFDSSSNQISLRRGKCEPCSDDGGSLSLSEDGLRRWPRTVRGEPRVPYYDVNLPL